ncbi:excitatory amino acid transporter 2 [Diaporthe amygdali]|uniref:excitatory amino acid transporter 2 n=1 Tax=Phomopsis amygdali TaxID=1214568 RepID=UPI0022FDE334|nr:excitatory amino acid transporter 2 [Diaporthe amygdali]KAJ0116962.1 excitatory amino acid transporter 2 [Diaporthe amygdali]
MGKEIQSAETRETWRSDSSRTVAVEDVPVTSVVEPKKPWWLPIKEPGSAAQIVISAVIAIAIGLAVTSTVDSVPVACSTILEIPGTTWLRALRATVLPLIITSLILAVQSLRDLGTGNGARIAKWTLGYYLITTIIAIVFSVVTVAVGWSRLMVPVEGEDREQIDPEREEVAPHDVVVDLFESLIPQNIVSALAEDTLLSVMVVSIIVGYLLKPASPILRVVKEIEEMVIKIIIFLIKLAPIGVFFLILPNMFRLDISEIGQNLGVLIGAALSGMFVHVFVTLSIIFAVLVKENPYTFFIRISPAWMTAWGSASSAATLPVTMRTTLAQGVPMVVTKFAVPVGCLVNMDGTAIYFPVVVTFMAATQSITIGPAQYVIITLLSTLATIGASPIPSSSLVLTVMICEAVNVPITGMYAVVVAIDWFLDRFRTAVNVSGDCYAAKVVAKMTGIKDSDDEYDEEIVEGVPVRRDSNEQA